jgi:polar amino acid transport system substrate-binding protein
MKANGEYEALVAAFMPADGAIVVPADLELTGDKTLKLGTNAAFPPFEYVDGSKIVGFDITMGQKIAADAGTKLEVVDMAFDSLIPALASGAIDFIAAGMSVTEERQKNVDFSLPYFESEQVIIIRK